MIDSSLTEAVRQRRWCRLNRSKEVVWNYSPFSEKLLFCINKLINAVCSLQSNWFERKCRSRVIRSFTQPCLVKATNRRLAGNTWQARTEWLLTNRLCSLL